MKKLNNEIYIPGFGNQDDRIRKSELPNSLIIQKAMRIISPEKASKYVDKIGIKKLQNQISKRYPDTTKEDFEFIVSELDKFQGLTRNIGTAISFTKKEIFRTIMKENCYIKLAGHSQGGIMAMEFLLGNPELLLITEEIELFAPVSSFAIARDFHFGKIGGYLNRKGVLVRKEFIKSLKRQEHSLIRLCNAIRAIGWRGKLKIIYSDKDPIIDQMTLDLKALKSIYPRIEIINKEAPNHYLGY